MVFSGWKSRSGQRSSLPSVVWVIRPERGRHVSRVRWHRVVGNVVVEVRTGAAWPVASVRREEARWSSIGDGRMRIQVVELLVVRMVMVVMVLVGRHQEILLVLIGGRIRAGRLHGLGEPSKVKFVCVSLAVDFGHNVLVVVVPQGPAQLVVVHVGLRLALAPPPGHLVGVHQLELAVGTLPRDAGGVGRVRE